MASQLPSVAANHPQPKGFNARHASKPAAAPSAGHRVSGLDALLASESTAFLANGGAYEETVGTESVAPASAGTTFTAAWQGDCIPYAASDPHLSPPSRAAPTPPQSSRAAPTPPQSSRAAPIPPQSSRAAPIPPQTSRAAPPSSRGGTVGARVNRLENLLEETRRRFDAAVERLASEARAARQEQQAQARAMDERLDQIARLLVAQRSPSNTSPPVVGPSPTNAAASMFSSSDASPSRRHLAPLRPVVLGGSVATRESSDTSQRSR